MFRGDPGLTGVARRGLPAELKVRWKLDLKEAVESTAAIVGGMAYVGADDKCLHAIDLRTGREKWEYQTKGQVRSSPCIVGGAVYFGDLAGTFHAVDARTGGARWTTRTDSEINSSANHWNGRLLFGSYDGFLYCVAAADGKVIWKMETEGRIHGAPAIVRVREGIPAGAATAPAGAPAVPAAGTTAPATTSPAEVVLVAGCDGKFHVFNLADGKSVAAIEMGALSGASPAVRGNLAFVGTFNNEVIAVNWVADRIVWHYRPTDRESPFYSSAAVASDTVVIGGRDKLVHAIDAGGGEGRWQFTTGGKIDASPVVAGDHVYVASTDGVLYALDLKSGVERWRFDSGSSFLASPAIGEGVLVIGTEDGVVYCFEGK
jgi:eukaryotic-like serine/threonine-protein kinase